MQNFKGRWIYALVASLLVLTLGLAAGLVVLRDNQERRLMNEIANLPKGTSRDAVERLLPRSMRDKPVYYGNSTSDHDIYYIRSRGFFVPDYEVHARFNWDGLISIDVHPVPRYGSGSISTDPY